MDEQDRDDQNLEQRRRVSLLLFQFVGLLDAALGVAIAVFGPGLVGGDPTVDTVLLFAGAFFVLTGIGIWWWGRNRFGKRQSGRRAGPITRRNR